MLAKTLSLRMVVVSLVVSALLVVGVGWSLPQLILSWQLGSGFSAWALPLTVLLLSLLLVFPGVAALLYFHGRPPSQQDFRRPDRHRFNAHQPDSSFSDILGRLLKAAVFVVLAALVFSVFLGLVAELIGRSGLRLADAKSLIVVIASVLAFAFLPIFSFPSLFYATTKISCFEALRRLTALRYLRLLGVVLSAYLLGLLVTLMLPGEPPAVLAVLRMVLLIIFSAAFLLATVAVSLDSVKGGEASARSRIARRAVRGLQVLLAIVLVVTLYPVSDGYAVSRAASAAATASQANGANSVDPLAPGNPLIKDQETDTGTDDQSEATESEDADDQPENTGLEGTDAQPDAANPDDVDTADQTVSDNDHEADSLSPDTQVSQGLGEVAVNSTDGYSVGLRAPDVIDVSEEPEGAVREVDHNVYSRTFEMPDGSYTTRFYSDPLMYQAEDGQEKDIDNTLVPADDAYTNAANSYSVDLPKSGEAFSITNEGYRLVVTPRFGELKNAVVSDNAIRYNDVSPGLDIQYASYGASLKEDIIISYPQDTYSFDFQLEASGIRFIKEGKAICGYRAADLEENALGESIPKPDSASVFTLTAPVMTDAGGNISEGVNIALDDVAADDGTLVQTVTLQAATDWINAPERI